METRKKSLTDILNKMYIFIVKLEWTNTSVSTVDHDYFFIVGQNHVIITSIEQNNVCGMCVSVYLYICVCV